MKRSAEIVVSAELIEQCLDRVARIIDNSGNSGLKYLPLYEYLERALEEHKAKDAATNALLDKVRQRVTRSADRTAA